MIFLLCVTITVFLCSIPFGVVFLCLFCDLDPREEGSLNIGMSNVWRLKGMTMGIPTLLGDVLKSYLALFIAENLGLSTEYLQVLAIIAVLSHCYSIFLGGKGGKGVATAGGVLLYLSPKLCLLLTVVWFVARFISNHSSIASLLTTLLTVVLSFWWLPSFSGLIMLISLFVLWRHKDNIKRLREQTELPAQLSSKDPL